MTEPYSYECERSDCHVVVFNGQEVVSCLYAMHAISMCDAMNTAYQQGVADTLAKVEERNRKHQEL